MKGEREGRRRSRRSRRVRAIDGSSICWFSLQMAATTRVVPGSAREKPKP